MTPIRIELLGKMRITFGQHLLTTINTNRMRSLLAFLVLNGDAAQSREQLAFLLWPESGEAQARTNLRQLLHNLRRALPVECSLLVTDNHTVHWRPDSSCTIDVVEFQAAVQAASSGKQGDTAVRKALEEAARLYQDDLLPDLYDDWLESRRARLRQKFADVLSRLAALLELAGSYADAIRHVTRLVALDPLREPYYQNLMRLHLKNADRSSALRVYHQCMRNLQRELGVSPGRQTQDLFMEALKSDNFPSPRAELPPYASTKPLQLVGRKVEWDRLLDCWRRVTEGEAHFALIVGEPGIGKSRLAEEMVESCSRSLKCAIARARCYFAQGQSAYGPVTELLRAESMRVAREHLPLPQLAEIARVVPEILVEHPEIAAPQPLTESWQRLHLYEALNTAFRRASKPLLLLIDDLQWCDRDSFEWLHSLFRSGAAEGVLVLGTARAGETGRDHPLTNLARELRQSGQMSELPLSPLSLDETAALAAEVTTRTCDPEFLNGLFHATKGNPLFVVESTRASLEDLETGRSVPPRVQAVIAARLAQLSPAAYELAGFAAIIGRPFSFPLLAKATDWDEDSLFRSLEELWQRRIIDGQGAAAVYDYTHDLLREVAYADLSPIRQRSLHRRVARALEELHGPDMAGISGRLAAHYDAAGIGEPAIRYYGLAASVANERFADAESAALLRRALQLCSEFPETAKRDTEELELLVRLGPSLVTTQGYSVPEVGQTYERGLVLSKRSDSRHLFSLRSGAWVHHIVRGDLEESRRLAQECVDGARNDGNQPQQMAGHFLLGTSLYHLGRLTEAWEQMAGAAASSDGPLNPGLPLFAGPDVGVFSRTYVSHLLCQFGDAEQALKKSQEAIARAREISHPFTLGIALVYAAMMHVYRLESKLALSLAEEAAAVCRKHEFAYYLALAEIFAGWATGAEGDTGAGLAQLRHGLDALKATGAELRLPFYYGLLAEVCGMAGRVGEALANVASGFAFLRKNGELWAGPELHRIHGDLLMRGPDTSLANASYRRAVESARATGSRLFEMRAAARQVDPQTTPASLAER